MNKTPITYYGGKQQMIRHILPLIPVHNIYTESFLGGGAVFWAKEPSKCEVLNDANMNVVNFYEVLKHSYFDLRKKIDVTLHSRETYKKALLIYETPELFAENPVIRAWAFYIVTNQGFSCKIGSWGYDKEKRSITLQNKIDTFNESLSIRLKYAQIECSDACKVIASRDDESAFHYVDPPYINSNQGHYGGYTEAHFKELLNTLSSVRGKFLLSSYPSAILSEYIAANNWNCKQYEMAISAGKVVGSTKKRKVEVLTSNY